MTIETSLLLFQNSKETNVIGKLKIAHEGPYEANRVILFFHRGFEVKSKVDRRVMTRSWFANNDSLSQ